jgi:DNA-binding XRE family transcriptional regulator
MTRTAIPVEDSFSRWREDPEYAAVYDALEDEFALAAALIEARSDENLSQTEIARRMGTSQPAVARLEGGRGNPSLATLRRYAEATGTKLRISFERPRKAG